MHDGRKPEPPGLGKTKFLGGDRSGLPVQIEFTEKHALFGQGHVVIRGKHSGHESQIHAGFLQTHATADLGVDIHLRKIEMKPFLKHREEQIQTVDVKAQLVTVSPEASGPADVEL